MTDDIFLFLVNTREQPSELSFTHEQLPVGYQLEYKR